MDLPPRIVELRKELNLRVPKVRDYLEAYPGVWTFFFPQHYSDTMDLRTTDPAAFLPLPEYIFSQDDSAPNVFAEQDVSAAFVVGQDGEGEQEEWDVHEAAAGDMATLEDFGFGDTASNAMVLELKWEPDLADFDHAWSCTDQSCDLCKKI